MLSPQRRTSFHFLPPTIIALAGGSRAPILTLPPIGAPLAVPDIVALVAAWGAPVAETAAEIMIFDRAFMAAEHRAVARTLKRMNG